MINYLKATGLKVGLLLNFGKEKLNLGSNLDQCTKEFWVNRKTSLDELPQLINVLKGKMSLVGPRPPIPTEVKEYEIRQRRRLSMKPALTCIWQITPRRNEVSFEEGDLRDIL